MRWLKALLQAFVAGGLLVAAPQAASMATDGYTSGEWRMLLAALVSGGIGGAAGLFVNTPRNPERRERTDDYWRSEQT